MPPNPAAPLPAGTQRRTPLFVNRPSDTIIITIDGPAGTGKSSVARALARRLGLDLLDTGAMYRAAAAIAIDRGIDLAYPDRIVAALEEADLHFDWAADPPVILAWTRPIDHRIRDEDVTAIVSQIAAIAPLREHMVRKQRVIWEQHPRLVAEGRDQGSVVFPHANIKFYLDASASVRAARRAGQLKAAGHDVDPQDLVAEITHRDQLDSTRAVGPLICPDDAVRIDTSDLSFDQVVDRLESIVHERVTGI